MKQRYYDGEVPSGKDTSINNKDAAPAVKYLFQDHFIEELYTALDLGCGRNARNSEWLAKKGVHVFRYDPYWGTEEDDAGWLKGKISKNLPHYPYFDNVFSCFVLNVVTKKVQDGIIKQCKEIAPRRIHIVRNDIVDVAKKALDSKNSITKKFYDKHFKKGTIEEFARFGFITSRGFQRQIDEIKGYELVRKTSGYMIFVENADA